MFIINLFSTLVQTDSGKATFARDARLSEMNRFDRFMQKLCQSLGLCRRAEE